MNLDGSDRKQLSRGQTYDGQPNVSRDGKAIAYISEQSGYSKVTVMNGDATNVRQLTSGTSNESGPIFSSDGLSVFFSRRNKYGRSDVISVSIDGKHERLVSSGVIADSPVCTSDDGSFVYTLSSTRNASFRSRKLAIRGTLQQDVLPFETAGGFDVSRNEQIIAYIDRANASFEYEVYVCRVDGSSKRKLTDLHGYIEHVQLSPDGRFVLFVLQGKGASGRGRGDIYTVAVDGSSVHKVGPNWSE